MIAFKGFNKDLTCTRGKGRFQYRIGETFTAEKAQCASTGLHCVEEPIRVLDWYSSPDSKFCIVEAKGDIHEDGGDKISCTEMKIVKELSLQALAMYECLWIKANPYRKSSDRVLRNRGHAGKGDIVIVRGKNPVASGEKGATLFLLKEEQGHKLDIEEIGVFMIDDQKYKSNKLYNVAGKAARCVKNC